MKTKRFLAQHFLVSKMIKEKIIDTVRPFLSQANSILEIGPGRGAITEGLSSLDKPLIVIEKDKKFVERLPEKYKGITVIEDDAAEFNLDKIEAEMLPTVIVGNLPYYAATDIILNILSSPSKFISAHFMVQHEVSLKFSTKMGEEYYSKYSIWSKAFFKTKVDFKVGKSSFMPPPKVLSAFMTFTPLKQALVDEKDSRDFYRFCSKLFLHPRKKFISNCEEKDKALAESLMTKYGIREDERPVNIPMELCAELFEMIGKRQGGG
jgi:16S rRNA (adenine1518-N6/adenine1519-N6)-dimethyltransferase